MAEKLQVIIDNCGEEPANRMITATTAGQFRILSKIAVVVMLALLITITASGQVMFKDNSDKLGLKLNNAAAAWADFNNNGFVDLCAGSVLWRNDSAKNFTKIANPGKVVLADFDNDGFLDLFSWSSRKLFRNVKGSEFVEVNFPQLPKSNGACCGDFDGDGYVDIYLGGYERQDKGKNFIYSDIILTNLKGQSFKISWRSKFFYPARGVTACDFDRDADIDIYVSNYRLKPNVLLLNDGNGNFKDVAADYNAIATSDGFSGGHSIGAAWGDFDNDGDFDLFAGNLSHHDHRGDQPESRFLRNRGSVDDYRFDDMGQCGIYYQESYATPAAGDYDNDGDLDLFFTIVYPIASFNKKNFPVLFRNDGNWTFKDVTSAEGLGGLTIKDNYQAAWADFDNDGDLDLVTAGKLFVNQGNPNNWLKVHLQGDGKQVNRSAIGAQVRIKLKDRTLTRQVEAGTGEGNQNDLTLHFGLGTQNKPVNLEIFWPNGTTKTVKQVRPNQLRKIRFSENK